MSYVVGWFISDREQILIFSRSGKGMRNYNMERIKKKIH